MSHAVIRIIALWALFGLLGCAGPDYHPNPKPPLLVDSSALPPQYRAASAAAAEFLAKRGENPSEFFVEFEQSNQQAILILHLWHQSAFEPRYRTTIGNPGGKNRDVFFDTSTQRVVDMLYWQ